MRPLLKKHTLYAIAITCLAACATNDPTPNPAPEPTPQPTPASPPTLQAPIVDNNLDWRKGKQQDRAVANIFVSQTAALGLPATIKLAFAQKRDEASGTTEQIETIKNVALRPLASAKIARNDKAWATAIRELAMRAAQAQEHEPQQILVSTTHNTRARIAQWINEGIAAAKNNHKPDVTIVETKQEKDTGIFYQPVDQKQFN